MPTLALPENLTANRFDEPLYVYNIQGLRLSSDTPLDGLQHVEFAEPDVFVRFGATPSAAQNLSSLFAPYFSDPAEDLVPVRAWSGDGMFYLRYGDAAEFAINESGSEVWVRWNESCAFDTVCAYLLGPVLGFVLRIRGVLCLHASTIQIADNAFALMGPCGSGKSTLATSFARAGYPVLSDDVTAMVEVQDRFYAQASGLRFKLWPDSLDAIYGSSSGFDRLVPDLEKRVVESPTTADHPAAPLRAIFFLQERSPSIDASLIEPIDPVSAMVSLASHTYANYLLTPEMRKREFQSIQRLLASVTVRKLTPKADLNALPELRQILCSEFEKQLETV